MNKIFLYLWILYVQKIWCLNNAWQSHSSAGLNLIHSGIPLQLSSLAVVLKKNKPCMAGPQGVSLQMNVKRCVFPVSAAQVAHAPPCVVNISVWCLRCQLYPGGCLCVFSVQKCKKLNHHIMFCTNISTRLASGEGSQTVITQNKYTTAHKP